MPERKIKPVMSNAAVVVMVMVSVSLEERGRFPSPLIEWWAGGRVRLGRFSQPPQSHQVSAQAAAASSSKPSP